jgi:7-cyano-7-deazaguanine synthase
MNSCIVLISGGLDSSVVLAKAVEEGFDRIFGLTFNYGQRHKQEIACAVAQAKARRVADHRIISFDMNCIGGSSLLEVCPEKESGQTTPSTYVPARNTVFLSFALALGEVVGTGVIYFGANKMDYNDYPDCRPEFFRAFENLANISTTAALSGKFNYQIKTPLIDMSKAEIIKEGLRLGVDFSKTLSCYNPDDRVFSCGICAACSLRIDGFKKSGAVDPIPYR